MLKNLPLRKYTLLLLSIVLFIHCEKEPETMVPTSMEPTEIPTETIEHNTPTGEENYLNLDSDYIFDQDKIPTFELTISSDNLARINANPSAEQYVEGSLTFEGETISPIGVRYKGSIGSYVGCLSNDSWANPSGYKTCTKLSMKLKINWEGRTDKFYGLKKLQLHSMNQDPSQMRDRLGYWLFSEMGVPSPRAVHARLLINGEFVGLFILVEQIDGRFTRYHLEDGEGNVYKEVWPLNEQGKLHADFQYRAALKTNEDENPSLDIMKGLASDIIDATDTDDLKNAISKWMEVDKIIPYAVVDRAIKHDDGPFHWYCFGGCNPHNFYFVEEPNKQKIHLVPWDLDNAFESFTNTNTVVHIFDDWGEASNNCSPFPNGLFGILQKSAVCDDLVYAMTLFDQEYNQYRQSFLSGSFSQSSVNSKLDTWAALISDATQEASIKHNDAISMTTWNNAITKLKQQCQISRSQ